MKIISWNCAGKFREKYNKIISYKPDLLVLQEVEQNIDRNKLSKLGYRFQWFGGEYQHKGLAILNIDKVEIDFYPIFHLDFRFCVPLKVLKPIEFNFMPVWTQFVPNKESYSVQLEKAIRYFEDFFREKESLCIGDYNAPYVNGGPCANISEIDRLFNELGINSLYHAYNDLKLGEHKDATFFQHRNKDIPSMLDYCYGSKYFQDNITKFEIGVYADWKDFSDHMPLFLEFK
jgi:exonuclease III